ncbi:transglycosylase domain-containing protein [Streptomyces sp. VRA16 Mangrove soil]|uniref:transglycosylase domain-containing protein n=1 Tax=Streptomyces sp. VRA16 Mangrove soil TaxID=2817434 RepID=UPI001A9CEA7F|nr:transglycosylase domain-containing protein [Streptomyces sp. VRA16 Mangrove soil]MBO1333759.1 penicillin-binding protein [Streptomyces sp. VRA16 Mangrove soil]
MGKKRSAGGGGGMSPAQQAAKFLGVSVLAGAVLAGIALPAAGALGLAAKGSVEEFDDTPAALKQPPLSQRTTILDSQGGKIATVYSRDRTVVKLDDISPYMQKAIVAIEDSRFYEHGAIDAKGILRAINANARGGGVAQGASTLTQQYVKNVFMEEAGDDPTKLAQATQQTIGRKVRELKYAIQIEKDLGKKKILANYLNITYFGQQAYGVEAASQRYFSKPAKELNVQEAALLAGIVQSPSRYDPVNDGAEAKKRRNIVLQRMADVHDISQAEADKAKESDLGLKVSRPENGCITAVKGAAFFCDYVEQVVKNDPVFGKTKEERAKLWSRGGLTIKTTLDPQSQDSVQASIKANVYKTDTVATAVTLVEPGTGKIVGMGQSRPYGFGKHEAATNYNVNHAYNGSNYGFPTGSTFKPFLAAAALEKGTPITQQYAAPYEMQYPSSVQSCSGKPWVNDRGYKLSNENESEVGPYRLKEAMEKSINTYFVEMLADTGMCPVVKMTDKLGVVQGNGDKVPEVPSSMTLGSTGLSPLTMASAYAAFANEGTYCTPVAIDSVTMTTTGKSLQVPQTKCSRAMSTETADKINTLLSGVTDSGTGQQAGLSDRDNAGKTGTTDGRKNAWFVGYTPNLAGAVWVGDPQQKQKMIDITIGGRYHAKAFGADTPGPIWRQAMTGALAGKEAPSFNMVDIPNPDKDKGKDKNKGGQDDGKPGDNNGNGGGNGGGTPTPDPTFTIPDGLIQGNENGGNGNGGGWGR